MKKIVLLFVMICVSLSTKAQIINITLDSLNNRKYEDRYLFNHCSREGMDLDIMIGTADEEHGLYSFTNNPSIAVPVTSKSTDSANRWVDYAQPYKVNAPVTIAGVSGFVSFGIIPNEFYDCCRWYFEIWDSTLTTVLRRVDISDTAIPHTYYGYYLNNYGPICEDEACHYKYTEIFFDEPLTITGKFYVVYHTPDSVGYPTGVNNMWSTIMGTSVCTPGTELYPLKRGGYYDIEYDWNYFDVVGYRSPTPPHDIYYDTITALYLFPILADSSFSGLEENNMLEAVRVFPNPADNEVNINSGYKIEKIFLYDESGKLLQEKEVKAYNYKIDLQHYPQGSYLLKVQTTKNQSTHKIIKQ